MQIQGSPGRSRKASHQQDGGRSAVPVDKGKFYARIVMEQTHPVFNRCMELYHNRHTHLLRRKYAVWWYFCDKTSLVLPARLHWTRMRIPPVNRSVNHIFRFLHICWQVTGKEWHRVRNADVSRWLTPGQHWCRWVLLLFHAFVRPSNHPWAWVCVLHTKRLEEMAYNLACWCIQMAYTQHSWMLMDIVVGLSVRPSVRLFVYGIFRWLCICWQITWNKWHKIWHADVSPSLISLSQHWC